MAAQGHRDPALPPAACLGVDGRCSPDVCPGWPGAVCSHGPSLKPAYRCLLACVSLRRPPSVCVTGGCVRVTVCVYELPNLRSGPPLNGRPLGLRITGGSCVLGGSVNPRVCACAKGRSARSAAPPKNLTHPSPRTRVCAVAVSVRLGGGCAARRPRIAPLRRSRLCAPLCVGTEGAGKCADGRIVRFSGLR